MPCTITGTLEGDRELAYEGEIEKLLKKAQQSNSLLCELLSIVRTKPKLYQSLPKRLLKWDKEHQRIDRGL